MFFDRECFIGANVNRTGDTDNAIFKYYIDGETTPSIEFNAPHAAGAFYDDAAMWGNAANGKGGACF